MIFCKDLNSEKLGMEILTNCKCLHSGLVNFGTKIDFIFNVTSADVDISIVVKL